MLRPRMIRIPIVSKYPSATARKSATGGMVPGGSTRPRTSTVLPKHPVDSGRHVEAEAALTPGSAASLSMIAWCAATAISRLGYSRSGNPTLNVSADDASNPGSSARKF